MENMMFKGIMPALITPFDENECIKKETVKELVDWQLSKGVQGFYICGTTGEGPVLQAKTRMEMAETVMEHTNKRGVVIDHISAPNMKDTIELTKHATKIGVDAIASLAPMYFFKYTEDEVETYYKTIADNTDLPVMVYATGMMSNINVGRLMEKLMKVPNIIGVKCTIRDYYQMRKIIEVNGGDINVINGPDETLLCGLLMGAQGGIGSTYNVMAEWYCQLYETFKNGKMEEARELQAHVNKVTGVLLKYGVNGVVKSVKETLELMGFDIGLAAPPAKALTAKEKTAMKKELEALGICFETRKCMR